MQVRRNLPRKAVPVSMRHLRHQQQLSMSTLPELPRVIADYLSENHVLGLATVYEGVPWAASCFYAFDPETVSLILLTSPETKHGEAMLSQPIVAGSISDQESNIARIRGIQLTGAAYLLQGEEEAQARKIYNRVHPVARIMKSSVWRIELTELKYTTNSAVFGRKLFWNRGRACM